ncbi:1-acylglycerol-3-phosphate O-acyltransferase PNPLA3 [Leptonychotes weddellii]|uniref:triacylglycerol lipase n=1 Tax=Leptonychotes weddellii TaxID=9713 RepID=A0A7F8PYM4_LEPWE|nr:1-acylglycerol-3-phosphate O-acyltransferase PNPLA3 [Leptonychotes weddellii]
MAHLHTLGFGSQKRQPLYVKVTCTDSNLLMQILGDLVQSARSRSIGILHPSFNLGRHIQKSLQRHLPDNIHRLISGKMCISLTRVSDGENVLVSDFQSKDEVVDALVCSSFIPFFSGIIPPSFRGVRYMDGGVSDNVPFFDAKTTITVSPFYGEYDICPKVTSTNFLHVDLTKLSLRLCSENVYLLMRALFPPDLKELGEICLRGYLDTLRFLEESGICNRPHPCLNLPSEELKTLKFTWGHRSLESPLRVATGRTKPEGDELPDHLRLSLLPWDESILDTLSPKLTAALSKAVKKQHGYVSKICNFLPIKTGDVASRYARGHPGAAVAHLECVFASDDTALPHLQIPDTSKRPTAFPEGLMKALLPSLLSSRGRS